MASEKHPETDIENQLSEVVVHDNTGAGSNSASFWVNRPSTAALEIAAGVVRGASLSTLVGIPVGGIVGFATGSIPAGVAAGVAITGVGTVLGVSYFAPDLSRNIEDEESGVSQRLINEGSNFRRSGT